MPCRDYSDYVDNPHTQRKLDLATRVACSTLKTLTDDQINRLPKETQAWWAAHQEQDRRRELAEKRERERKQKRNNALAKLTDEERKLLNL